MTTVSATITSVLPPRALLLALIAQVPLLLSERPLRPSAVEVALGIALLAAGVTLNIRSASLFKRNRVGVCPFTPAPVLVTDGPYRLTRNPMYVGLVAICAGAALSTGVPANLWISVTFAVWLHYAYVLPEEDFLRQTFGVRFEHYSSGVPRWLFRCRSPWAGTA